MKLRQRMILSVLAVCSGGLGMQAAAAGFTEPYTVFYGKVLGTGSGQPYSVYEGDITWAIQAADGSELELMAQLTSLKDGEYSYRLNVPHSALSLGLAPMTNSVPLGSVETLSSFPRIEVDGEEARIVGSLSTAFFSSQAMRTATYRMDLEIPLPSLDTDGDGLPDWWEDRFGLDKQDGSDAAGDGDGDGLSNLDEFAQGFDPTMDSRAPMLVTTEQMVFADARNALLLRSRDLDSAGDELTYTLLSAPAEGRMLVMPEGNDLLPGDSFTQSDVDRGSVVYDHNEASALPVSFDLALRDSETNHPPAVGTVWLYPFRPAQDLLNSGYVVNGETPRSVDLYLLAANGERIVVDASVYRDDFTGLPPLPSASDITEGSLLLSGSGSDRFVGTLGDDVFVPGDGNDAFEGAGGRDIVRVDPAAEGTDTWADFSPAEGDTLDLSRILNGASVWLGDYVSAFDDAGSLLLNVSASGVSGVVDYAIRLEGHSAAGVDLNQWVESGALVVGDLRVLPRVFVEGSLAAASENGPTSSDFVLQRTGDVSEELIVNVLLGGAAQNGSDYSLIADTVRFPAGEREVSVPVIPFADSQAEPDETVQLTLIEGSGYELGTPAQAQIVIEDLRTQLSLELLVSHGVRTTQQSAFVLLKRSELVNQSVLARLRISGTATAGSDYNSVLTFVNFGPGDTSVLIPITPLVTGSLANGAETVLLELIEDPAYRKGDPSVVEVTLVDELDSFEAWLDRSHPDATGAMSTLVESDLGGKGRTAFLDYVIPEGLPSPRLVLRDGEWSLDAWLRPDVPDVKAVVEYCSDLSTGTWIERTSETERVYSVASDIPGIRSYRLRGLKEQPSHNVRLRLMYRP